MTIYTEQVRMAVNSIKPPHEFVVDIVEYDLDPKHPFIGLRFYESQWNYFSEMERLRCITYLEKLKAILTGYGINATLEPVIDTGETMPEEFKRKRNI